MHATIPASADSGGIRPLSGKEYRQLRDLIHHEAGIFLSPVKKPLIVGRLSKQALMNRVRSAVPRCTRTPPWPSRERAGRC